MPGSTNTARENDRTFGPSGRPQTPAYATLPLSERLIALEREGWEALVAGNGGTYYREHLSANALMVFPFGALTRQEAIDAIESAAPWERFEIRNPLVVELGHDSGVVVYGVLAQRPGRAPYVAMISSTFVREGDQWKLAFHQQSPSS
jgi:hypothetical protein